MTLIEEIVPSIGKPPRLMLYPACKGLRRAC